MNKSKLRKENVLVIGDTHLPFEHRNYLEFVLQVQKRCKCGTVVHIGDLVDNHSISYHEHDPDGWSPADEMRATDKHLEPWFKAFPNVKLCRGNHDALVDRKGKTVGLPRRCFHDFRDIWNLPKGWEDGFKFVMDGVLYKHLAPGGKFGYITAAERAMMNTVTGHGHSTAGVGIIKTETKQVFGMGVGCGLDEDKYAFAYGRDFPKKPILGCGVVVGSGKYVQFFPMEV